MTRTALLRTSTMDQLHTDLLTLVVVHLPLRDFASLRLVGRRFRLLLDSESLCRKYYIATAPLEMRIEEPPSDMTWRRAVERLPLLLRVAPLLSVCVTLWPSLVSSQLTNIAHTVEIHESTSETEEAHSVQLGPRRDDATKMWLERLVDGQATQTVGELSVADLYRILFSLLLDGGRSLGLGMPLESTGRRIDFLCIGDEEYHRLRRTP